MSEMLYANIFNLNKAKICLLAKIKVSTLHIYWKFRAPPTVVGRSPKVFTLPACPSVRWGPAWLSGSV